MASVFGSVRPPVGASTGSGAGTDAGPPAAVSVFGSVRPPVGASTGETGAGASAAASVFGSVRPPVGASTGGAGGGAPAAASVFGAVRPPVGSNPRLDAARPAHLSTSSSFSARAPPTKNQIAGLFSKSAKASFSRLSCSGLGNAQMHEDGIVTALQASLVELQSPGAASAASTIANLALRPEIQDALIQPLALGSLVKALGHPDDAVRRFVCMSLSRVAARRDLSPSLVEQAGLVELLLDISEEVNSKGGLWRQALRVLALLAAFARAYFISEPGEWLLQDSREASPRAHLGALADKEEAGGGPEDKQKAGATDTQGGDGEKIRHEDRMRLLLGLKRLLVVEQTELQTDAMQALVPWTRHKEHVALLSSCGLWNAVVIAAKAPAGEYVSSLSELKAQHGALRPGSSMQGVLQTMAINLIRCLALACRASVSAPFLAAAICCRRTSRPARC